MQRLSFIRNLKRKKNKQFSDRKQDERKIYVVNRNLQTPLSQQESNLLCNEDLDLNLLSNDSKNEFFNKNPNFAGMINPEWIGIPSDISNFEKCYKSETSSHLRTEEGFEEFMRWGNKFGGESQNNSPPPIARKLNEDSSFTFTKKDEKSPVKDISKTITEESKIEELEIEECSPKDFPSVNIPRKFTSSGAGEVFEKHLERINDIYCNNKTSKNSICIPESQSHKASIIQPKVSRNQFKSYKVSKSRKKPYSYKSNFQWGSSKNKRSRNSSKTGSYFTEGNNFKPKYNDKLSRNSKASGSKLAKGNDGFKGVELFTFAKQTPKMVRQTPNSKKKSPLKTPTSFMKKGKEKNKKSINHSSKLWTSNTKYSVKAKSSDKKKYVLKRQITTQASKKLSYGGRNSDILHKKHNITPFKTGSGSSIRNIKQNSSLLKKNLIENMVSNKLNSVENMRVRVYPKEPTVHTYSKYKRVRPLTSSKDSKDSKNSLSSKERNINNYSANYVPKYRQSLNNSKIVKDLSKVYKGCDKENMSRNQQIFSPILSMNESDYSSIETVKKKVSPFKENKKKDISTGKRGNYGKFIKKPAFKSAKKPPFTNSAENLKNQDIVKLVKMNLDLIQAFSKGIEASRSIISSLASAEGTSQEEINLQLKTIEDLNKEFNTSKYSTEIKGILNNKKPRKNLR